MNVSVALSLAQMVVGLKLALAVGLITVRVTDWFKALVQLEGPGAVTLTKVIIVSVL